MKSKKIKLNAYIILIIKRELKPTSSIQYAYYFICFFYQNIKYIIFI